jgi:type III restriction enzyme
LARHGGRLGAQGHLSPPVMLTVCNRTETAARVEHYFHQGPCALAGAARRPAHLRVDSKVLEKAEMGEPPAADKDYEQRLRAIVEAARIPETARKSAEGRLKKEELLRELVDNVGKRGQAGRTCRTWSRWPCCPKAGTPRT